jgi:hypothetical protein
MQKRAVCCDSAISACHEHAPVVGANGERASSPETAIRSPTAGSSIEREDPARKWSRLCIQFDEAQDAFAQQQGKGQHTVTGTCLQTTLGTQTVIVYGTCFATTRGRSSTF